ncbi:MAG TPA: LON peptidase substrate-binding domain-containing protein [Ktedonobacterales bacterium]|jgi:Lon protease-like protein|nr:LON peptidase substrate-binding domain-containing protein [Ktedonobacterales bacterium]
MADQVMEIPLFPLNLVLFPGMVQPLHIFEPRYREMTRYCLDTNVSFGVTLATPEAELSDDESMRFGTLARIADYQRLPDGRYNLIAVGVKRFEIIEVRRDKPYLSALVRVLPEQIGAGDIGGLTQEARGLLDDYLSLVLSIMEGGETTITAPKDTIELSYFIAVCLPCDDLVKQTLLEAETAVERLSRERDLLRKEIAAISEQILNDDDANDCADQETSDNRDRFN